MGKCLGYGHVNHIENFLNIGFFAGLKLPGQLELR
jgi:hypothetical protein